MNPPGPDLKVIFSEALDHPAGPGRSAYLDRICGEDATLRHKVESLLMAHGEAGGFLGSGDHPQATPDLLNATADHAPDLELDPTVSAHRPAIAEGPGTTIGPYKLLQKIGEGGMGAVFMAEQERPVRRKVALKVIKPGMDTGQVIARFEAERQALAMMDHPNIARVLDVGATDTGRPFFVMELVKGVPITEYCDRNGLTPRERLELFLPVCRAIQHAHQKGIIHRDIKPSNVLVTLHDGIPMPKVIDFGVAKAIDQRLTERTMFTEFGAIIGTLEYMSPEQAEVGALDIDTRSDIYSLGVLLYELLTGSTPLERAKLRKAAFSEILKRIREEEPTKPSTRLSESKDALPSISAQRKMEPARLAKLVRGDLDWIVMKSLEKDRTRRYETATGFARDIRRYLDGDAVEACPPSASYKLRKFARKHRAGLATIGAFAFLLVAATAISAGLAYRANRERVRAVRAEKDAKDQEARAADREQMAIDAVKRFRDAVADEPALKNTPALEDLRKRLLKEPIAFFRALRDRIQADRDTRPESLARLAQASFELGNLMDEIGDKHDAVIVYLESLAILHELADAHPDISEHQRKLAICLNELGRLLIDTGKPAEAMNAFDSALAVRQGLVNSDPAVSVYHRDLSEAHHNIGSLLMDIGKLSEGMKAYESALVIQQRLATANPTDSALKSILALSHFNIGRCLKNTGGLTEALKAHESALSIRQGLAAANPTRAHSQAELASSYDAIGGILGATGKPTEALNAHKLALAVRQRLADANPTVSEFRYDLMLSHGNIGGILSATGEQAEAMRSYESALAIGRKLADANPTVTAFQKILAGIHNNIGIILGDTGRPEDAMRSYESALVIQQKLAREHPEMPEFATGLGSALNNIATVDLNGKRFEEARGRLRQAVEWQRKALTINPRNPAYRQFLDNMLGNLIKAARELGDTKGVAEAERELAKLRDSDPMIVALDARLAEVVRGYHPSKDNPERLRLAQRANDKALHAAAARLFAEALANDPKLADDRQAQHAYNAACAAALAGSGRGKDDPPPDDAARAKLRRQAREWLRAELVAWAKVLNAGPADIKAMIAPTLRHWKVTDVDLAGIRDDKELAKLPEEERAAFKQLWADVDRLLAQAPGGK